ncbi:IclR family transcriptional regulator [Streptomonospora sp. S1-112]|uniref:IclR family transcriptional regulator n=1 Tax=Streptomonospora mangrovi TaxID=2883123 RepID=A0A9X3SNB9_9ACTN|nr:IclR family transcriptional regulator [Streptomonospora mangrovi]MDA0565046.1 IclR family transcriptional regulator [Streptomonospora mangrovi]
MAAGREKETVTDRTLDVLEALAHTSRLADIAAATDLPKPTVHRILQRMVARDFVRTDGQGHYTGGPRVLSLAGRYMRQLDLPQRSYPVLNRLQQSTEWTVHLAVLTGDEAVYAAKLEGSKPYHLASRVGMQLALHCTSVGKAMLARLPEDRVRALLARTGMPPRTPNTITDEERLRAELEAVRARGYAEDREENELGVHAVGAAITDYTGEVVAGVSAAALVHLPTEGTAAWRGEQVAAAAREISGLLGAP